MKKILLLLLSILILTPLFSVTELTSKGIKLLAGQEEVTNIAVRTISSQGLTQYNGMPFRLMDEQAFYRPSAGNPSYGNRIIARWDVISNRDFAIKIEASPLMHEYASNNIIRSTSYEISDEVQNAIDKQAPLFYRLAQKFVISYLTNGNTNKTISGYYVFEPEENIMNFEGRGRMKIYLEDSSSVISSGQTSAKFSSFVNDYSERDSEDNFLGYIGSLDQPIYIGFTEETTKRLQDPIEYAKLVDGLYTAQVTVTVVTN